MNCSPCIEHPLMTKTRILNSREIIEKVGNYLNVLPEKIYGKTRWRHIAEARQICCYLLRSDRHLNLSLKSIGFILNKRDHTTILHSVKVVNNLMEVDEEFREKVKNVYLEVYGTLKYFPE